MNGELIRVALVESDRVDECLAAMRHVAALSCDLVVPRGTSGLAADEGENASSVDMERLCNDSLDLFDVAIVDSPLVSRVATAIRLAKSGKQACVCFPPGSQQSEWMEMLAAFQDGGVPWAVINPLRLDPYVDSIRDSLQSGDLGAPGLLRIHQWSRSPAIERLDEVGIVMLAAAQLDVACWLFGDRPSNIYAVAVPPTGRLCQALQIHLGFDKGGMAQIGRVIARDSDPYSMVTLVGSRGAAYADDHHNTNLLMGERTESMLVGRDTDSVLRELNALLDSMNSRGVARGCSPADMENVYHVSQAVAMSLQAGRAAAWTGERYELS